MKQPPFMNKVYWVSKKLSSLLQHAERDANTRNGAKIILLRSFTGNSVKTII